MKPKRVGHLVLNVGDLEASERFYTEVLGFEVSMKAPAGTFLTCGKVHHDLAVFQAPEDAAPVSSGQIGLNHFAIQVEDIDALNGIYQRLKDHGVSIDNTTEHTSTNSVYFRDPDGLRVEFFCNTAATAAEGLELMRSSGGKNDMLILEEIAT